MKTFRLTGVMTFDAENIDDAFTKLAEHFKALSEGEDDMLFVFPTSFEITSTEKPTEDE